MSAEFGEDAASASEDFGLGVDVFALDAVAVLFDEGADVPGRWRVDASVGAHENGIVDDVDAAGQGEIAGDGQCVVERQDVQEDDGVEAARRSRREAMEIGPTECATILDRKACGPRPGRGKKGLEGIDADDRATDPACRGERDRTLAAPKIQKRLAPREA